MPNKTHNTALVLIPPESIWESIQAIRQQYDKNVRRWMPHITLLYPFRPRTDFDTLLDPLSAACRTISPFELTLRTFRHFDHNRRKSLWLDPEPTEAIVHLQEALWNVVPDCNDVRIFSNGFTPHLSIGQTYDHAPDTLQSTWQPLTFHAAHVHLIWRNDPPDDIFRIAHTLPLGNPIG
ncbi:MAG: 2'-5' RNA ligase family protein [bacterium]|nr:2'-5' RNA ligase family protein [bacterium]